MSGRKEKAARKVEILGPDGMPARGIEATESEEPTPATLQDFIGIVCKHFPHLGEREQLAQARAMLARHPIIEQAYRAGLRIGRDLRERTKYGRGWNWPELEPLMPKERTFVLGKVKAAIGLEH